MESRIAGHLRLDFSPLALLWKDERPENALQFAPGKWGCVMAMAAAAVKGRTACFSRETFGCFGGGVGLGFGNRYLDFPGGLEGFCRFLSTGNAGCGEGEKIAEALGPYTRKEFIDDFLHGERYIRSPELVRSFIEKLPMTDIPASFVVLKPIVETDPGEEPVVIVFFVNPDQLSALTILANYGREDMDNVIIPYAAGCQTIGIIPYREARSPNPRAVVGMTDISARKYTGRLLGKDKLTFTVPYRMFLEMEEHVPGSFLEGAVWKSLLTTS